MEKNFTLMKTLTAFFKRLLFRRRENSRPVNNDQTSTTGCSSGTTVTNYSKHTNDAKQADASFLFFDKPTVDDERSPQSMDNDQKSKSNYPGSYRESKKINDELALGSSPTPVNKSWKERVNDDLAACSGIVSRQSVVASREWVNVSDVLKSIFPTTRVHNETRTNKNDAFLPFASFSFFIRRFVRRNFNEGESLGEGGLLTEFFKNQKPVLLTIPIHSKGTRQPNQNDAIKL